MQTGKGIRMRRILSILGNSLLETVACYPYLLLYMIYAMGVVPSWLLPLICLLHTLGTLVGTWKASGKKVFLPAALLMAVSLLPLAVLGIRAAILSVLILLMAVFRGLIVGRKELWRAVQLNLPLAGLAASLIVYGASSRVQAIEPYRMLLYFMSLFTLFTLLLRWNGDRVRSASNAQETDRQLLRRILFRNRWMTWLVLALIALLSMWNGLGEGLAYFKHWLAGLFNGMDGGEHQQVKEQLANPQQGPMRLPPPSHPPKWVHIVSQVMLFLLEVAVVAVLLFLLYWLLRRWLPESLRTWIARLARSLRLMREIQRTSLDEGDYVDEMEKIERVRKRPGKLRRGRKEDMFPAESGDPRGAYERLIRRAIKRGYPFRSSLTPSENGAAIAVDREYTGLGPDDVDQIVNRYNEVRYGFDSKPEHKPDS
ncbi:DUF4129 domain-containing protein [Paenibacillus sp.]|jgi:hypothetical protein|uniref:DUF4129 domain-containing protein n=1 Tax=Paenibacillus sp. TaxID=58172 RepID=UPI00283891EC|nr:DUF4129 domain-containing protein [Paenibacillus sp.]MDR0270407.1 DUF4129 domain-containing protein [Paenibacillus sp.]